MLKHSLLLGIIFVFLSGCAAQNSEIPDIQSSNPPPAAEPAAYGGNTTVSYKDGIYTSRGEPWKYGYEDATVVISGNKITNVILRRFDNLGKEVNYDQWTGREMNEVTGERKTNLKQTRKEIGKRMVDQQTFEVDTISGATISSINWKLAAKRALDQASK